MVEFTESIVVSMPDVYTIVPTSTPVEEITRAIDQAVVVIETISGVLFEAYMRETPVSARDAAWVRRATVFQAAWLLDHADALSRMGVDSLSQEGLSVSASNGLTFVLAPMAKRALNNCSWAKTGTLAVDGTEINTDVSFLTNDNHPWTPMGVS